MVAAPVISEQQPDQLHQSADQGANVLLMAEAIGGARSGEDPDGDKSSKKEPV